MATVGDVGSRPLSFRGNFATLDDLRVFLNQACPPGWRISYSADVGIWSVAKFCITLKRRYARASDSSLGFVRKDETSRTFDENLRFFDVIRTMVECPAWTRGDFVFRNESDFVPELNDQMVQLFALLGSSRGLSTVDILFDRFYHSHLPRLLSPLRSLETLILDARSMSLPEHAGSIAQFLEQTSTLKSCTLVLNSCEVESGSHSAQGTILRPFTNAAQCAALKELVLRVIPSQEIDFDERFFCERLVCANCHQAIANLVRHDTSLVKLELCCSYSSDAGCALVGSALAANHTLKELGFPCSLAGLIELVRPLVPSSSGRPQANTSLSTLNLFPKSDCLGVQLMNELAALVRSNNSLKSILVTKQRNGNSWPAWEDENLTAAKHVESKTWKKLQSLMENELRENTSLNSLVVGNWTLLRVETGWDLHYGGPCLKTSTNTKDYCVSVTIDESQIRPQ